MTDSENPEPPGALFGEIVGSDRSALPASSAVPGSETLAAPGFSSRREMREAEARRPSSRRDSRPRRDGRPAARVRATGSARRSSTREIVRDGAKPAGSGWRRKLSSAGVMTLVVGLFASLTLPAFADQNPHLADQAKLDGQRLEVTAATTDESAFIRDSYGTTSASDLRQLYADALRQQNLAAYLASGARELGDDYPWPDMLTRAQGGGLSPLNYYYRECVDFVAWRLNRDAGTPTTPFRWVWTNLAQGSAHAWKSQWQAHGWPTGTEPAAGAVAYFPGQNHVAYVSGILPDGSVAIEEYNYGNDHAYGQRVIAPGDAYYLYAPPA